jgi:hypothetical protein
VTLESGTTRTADLIIGADGIRVSLHIYSFPSTLNNYASPQSVHLSSVKIYRYPLLTRRDSDGSHMRVPLNRIPNWIGS